MGVNQPSSTLALSKVCPGLFNSTYLSCCTLDCISFLLPNWPLWEGSRSLDSCGPTGIPSSQSLRPCSSC